MSRFGDARAAAPSHNEQVGTTCGGGEDFVGRAGDRPAADRQPGVVAAQHRGAEVGGGRRGRTCRVLRAGVRSRVSVDHDDVSGTARGFAARLQQ